MKPKPTARLRVILARKAPLAVVIRFGPAKQVRTSFRNRHSKSNPQPLKLSESKLRGRPSKSSKPCPDYCEIHPDQ
jgi:hypothetical protein